MATAKKEVGRRTQRIHLTLPQEAKDTLLSLKGMTKKAYIKNLLDKGWTYQSIADVLGVTRQAVEIYSKPKYKKQDRQQAWEQALADTKSFPMPELPTTPIYKTQRVEASAEAVAELKRLHDIAKQVRGKGQKHRAEADQFTRLAWEQVQQGISVYSLAKSIGITTAALQFRFVRYGYKVSNGKSKAYVAIKHGVKEMSNVIQIQQASVYSNAEVEIRVSLADMEQPVVMIGKITTYNHTTGNYNKEPRKFRINEMVYVFDVYSYTQKNEVLKLARANGNFFLKGNKKIGGKTDTLYLNGIDITERKNIVSQIPAHLHNYAEKELQTELKQRLDYMLRVGVVI